MFTQWLHPMSLAHSVVSFVLSHHSTAPWGHYCWLELGKLTYFMWEILIHSMELFSLCFQTAMGPINFWPLHILGTAVAFNGLVSSGSHVTAYLMREITAAFYNRVTIDEKNKYTWWIHTNTNEIIASYINRKADIHYILCNIYSYATKWIIIYFKNNNINIFRQFVKILITVSQSSGLQSASEEKNIRISKRSHIYFLIYICYCFHNSPPKNSPSKTTIIFSPCYVAGSLFQSVIETTTNAGVVEGRE